VTEGVETEQQRDLLEKLNCDVMQGYLFAKPLAPRDLEQWVRKGGAPAVIREIEAARASAARQAAAPAAEQPAAPEPAAKPAKPAPAPAAKAKS
ncbi:EAL domain-containing protein, partial [Komagataeibacter oboediens]